MTVLYTYKRGMAHTLFTFALCIILSMTFTDAGAQSMWSRVKEKASMVKEKASRAMEDSNVKEKASRMKEKASRAMENSNVKEKASRMKEKASRAMENSNVKEKASRMKEKASRAMENSNVKEKASKVKGKASRVMDKRKYKVPYTGRTFTNIIPDKTLYSLSNDQYHSYLKSSTISRNKRQNEQVRRVSQRLYGAVKRLYEKEGRSSELSNFHWEFNVIKKSEANASCMYGGKIMVYDGMFKYANDDASLAIVLGHEIGHALAKHSAEQMTKGIITAGGMAIAYTIISCSDMSERKKMITKILAQAGATLATLKFSRIDEVEADHIGLILAAMAGYDPSAAIPFWKRMEANSSLKTNRDWFSTHPSYENRIANIRSFLPEAKKYYY